jgi:hypothetical protein
VNVDHLQERRKAQRFPADDGCLITFGNDPIRLWRILDISKEGLAFRYIGGAENAFAASSLDILTRDTSLCIEEIPFKVVSDLQMQDPAPRPYLLKRCGVLFGRMTDEQKRKLETLIQGYTKPGAP